MAKVIVVGAGPAGIMAALSSAKNNEVVLIERNSILVKNLSLLVVEDVILQITEKLRSFLKK